MQKENQRSTLYDYAFLKLKEPVELDTFLKLGDNFENYASSLAIYGYPGNKYNKTVNGKIMACQFGVTTLANSIVKDN